MSGWRAEEARQEEKGVESWLNGREPGEFTGSVGSLVSGAGAKELKN